jgi:hypothetical protein
VVKGTQGFIIGKGTEGRKAQSHQKENKFDVFERICCCITAGDTPPPPHTFLWLKQPFMSEDTKNQLFSSPKIADF